MLWNKHTYYSSQCILYKHIMCKYYTKHIRQKNQNADIKDIYWIQGFSTKFLVGGLAFKFWSLSGMESDGRGGGTWKNHPLRPKIPPYSKIRANFLCFRHKIELSDAVLSYKVVKIKRKRGKIFRELSWGTGSGQKVGTVVGGGEDRQNFHCLGDP